MSSTSSTSTSNNATSSSSTTSVAERKRRLDFAIQQVLTNNFDADSKVCLITLMKMIDNLLSKPDNLQVRSIRLMNKTFQTKVVQKQGHIILLAVGFVSSSSDEGGGEEEKLVLHPQNEDTQFLVETRRKIHSVLVHELHCKPDALPVQPEPRNRVEVRTTVHPSGHTTTTTSTGFDVYQGHKFDGQSQAVGVNLGPPSGWKSKTEQELEILQNRQKVLEEEKQKGKNGGGPDRQWELLFPGQKSQQQLTSQQGSIVSSLLGGGSGSGGTTAGDSSLIAQHYKQQAAKRLEAENRGFTTKAMRDLEKIKKQKVYGHTVLAITFADGVVVKGAFKPREKIQAVINELHDNVLTSTSNEDGGGGSIVDFELYQTPPRTLCKASETLYDLGLVPAAKVHVSWKTKPSGSKSGSSSVGTYLRRDFVERYQQQQSSVTMPKGTSVVDGADGTTGKNNEDSKKKSSSSAAESGGTKKKKTKAEKERDLLARMMGK
eukprot:CAMPEP_0113459042 /NCGR_PEP_ID=MMETSP0014_2-20120614/10240_1 /TAXON_ID=2857 /ORGANISM="Nitzschia sp." /LENGTH=488 /DNA_ID=CAMNT_0000350597 /DNA_START=109 /DNA_END=1575 /DNA_ORIENTATION=+ /assembly_acc=CAM_ASM_000159